MSKQKIKHKNNFSEKMILSLYGSIFPLLYNNPDGVNIFDVIKQQLAKITPFDYLHYVAEDPHQPITDGKLSANFELYPHKGSTKIANISRTVVKAQDHISGFAELIEKGYNDALNIMQMKKQDTNYYRITSTDFPQIAIGLFKHKAPFTVNEINSIEKLKPHIFTIYRTIVTSTLRTPTFQYFTGFNNICTSIAKTYNLSETEYKLIQDLLFGLTNKQIADKFFISILTVKTHIHNILKKTNTKNRLDFIATFFTSPAHVEI
jgi:DNA-binding CsgD family transcriptional regulator